MTLVAFQRTDHPIRIPSVLIFGMVNGQPCCAVRWIPIENFDFLITVFMLFSRIKPATSEAPARMMIGICQSATLPSPPNKKACDYQQACYKLSDVDGHTSAPCAYRLPRAAGAFDAVQICLASSWSHATKCPLQNRW